MCRFTEARDSLAKNAHDHFNDLLKHRVMYAHNFIRQYRVLGLLFGGVASFGHIFKINLSPDHSS
jgi:hypothetical protein